jgi:predicted ester cyclase
MYSLYFLTKKLHMKNTLFIAVAFATFSFASCNNPSTNGEASKTDSTCIKTQMKNDRNKKTAMESIDGINAHDAGKVMKDASPDFMDYGDGSMPPQKIDSAKQMLAMFLSAFPDAKVSNTQCVADGNTVMAMSDWSMTFKNDMMGIKATGKTVQGKDIDIFTFDDNGKITSHRNIYPSAAIFANAGVDMAKMQAMMAGAAKPQEKKK